MKTYKIWIFLTAILIVHLSSSAQQKDKIFYQEYHKAYPLLHENENKVNVIAIDKSDDIWAGTKAGLFKLNKSNKKWSAMLEPNFQGPINDIHIGSNGMIWVAAWNGLYKIQNSSVTKISGIVAPIGVVQEINKSIIAIGPEGIWHNKKNIWTKKPVPYTKSVRKLIPDRKNGYFLATGKGLYHKSKDHIKKFQTKEEILSDDIYGLDFSDAGNLWVGGAGGITIFKNDKKINSYTPENGLPTVWINCVKKSPDGTMWIGTRNGLTRFDGNSWSLRHSKRWLLSDDVKDIQFDKKGTAWIATSKGVSAILKKEFTLEDKANYYHDILKKRHIRAPYLVEKCRLTKPGDLSTWEPRDDDNDGQYTSMYLAMESYRYAVTNNPEAKENALKAFNALHFLQEVTETNGFVARTVIPVNWETMADANKNISDREWAENILNEPRLRRIEDMWKPSTDGKWLWKRGTSSDEITGHMYGYYIYHELVAKGNEKVRVKELILKIVDYIIDGGYVFKDIDGKHTVWGVWAPEYLNDNPDWITERGINSLEILSYLKLAYHVSKDEKYQKEFYKLWNDHHYSTNISEAKTTRTTWVTYIDDELLALAYPVLIDQETDPQVKNLVEKSLDTWYDALKNDDNPYFYFLYDGLTGKKIKLERSKFILEDNPLDLIRWTVDNSKREDLEIIRKPILEYKQTSRLVPPSERGIMRWDNNPWKSVQGDGGHSESDGVYWMLAYWTGRYYKLIE